MPLRCYLLCLVQSLGLFLELDVEVDNENVPVVYNYTAVNSTTNEVLQEFFCYNNFQSVPPSSEMLAIPSICQREGLMIKQTSKEGRQRLLHPTTGYSQSCHDHLMLTELHIPYAVHHSLYET